eukprot:m.106128 g.106128  ORF g.106128 m.106128 type:complete len:382 (-) comp9147_c2_seq1:212-1357(-)
MNDKEFVLFSLMYWMVVTAVVFKVPPFSYTLDSIWRKFLGNEGLHFVNYHIKRGLVMLIMLALVFISYAIAFAIHSPLVLESMMHFNNLQTEDSNVEAGNEQELSLATISGVILVYVLGGCGLTFLLTVLIWTYDEYKYHPTRAALEFHSTDWRQVMRSINAEYRNPDKISVPIGYHQVSVTDSWLLQTNLFLLNFALQDDADFSIVDSTDVTSMEHETAGQAAVLRSRQLIRIRVTTLNPNMKEFAVLVTSDQYHQLQLKITTHVQNIHNIILRQTPNDHFLAQFRNAVQQHAKYEFLLETDDMCIGCKSHPQNAKIVVQEPKPCSCRPFFCVDCLGRWFASRQDQNLSPEAWMRGRAKCPTCPAQFMVTDIAEVIQPDA